MIAQHIITLYQQLLVHSQTMLRLAGNGQWDELIETETQYVGTVEKLTIVTRHAEVPKHTQQQLQPVLRHILANETELKALMRGRMSELSTLMNQAGQQKSVNKAYSQTGGQVLFPHLVKS